MMGWGLKNLTDPFGSTSRYAQGADQRKKRKISEAVARQNKRNEEAKNAIAGNPSDNILSGTEKEQQGQVSGLNLAAMGYGQGIKEIGQDIQGVKKRVQDRSAQSGADPVSAAIMGQKASDVAMTQRGNIAGGVKGAAAASSAAAIGRQKDDEIRRSLYGQQAQSIEAERSLLGNMLSGTTSLMQGEKAANVQLPSAPSGGGGGTVICTELHRQGIMPSDIYKKDAAYGAALSWEVAAGYRFWATPLANKMKTSPLLTCILKIPAMKWAKHIAGTEKSVFGYACQYIGEPVCGIIGTLLFKFTGAKYV
jgi:hypothetical protein